MIFEMKNVSGKKKRGFNLKDITLSVPEGCITGITGKNGSGKTTLLKYIASPEKQYSGQILADGCEIHKTKETHRNLMNIMAYISDDVRYFNEYSAALNGKLLSVFYKDWDEELYKKILLEFNLASDHPLALENPLSSLSRGEYIKFQMAFAMAHHTKLYLLDEVTGGMDPIFRKEFFRILHRVMDEDGASVIMTTHLQEEIDEKIDYVGILEEGRLVSAHEQ